MNDIFDNIYVINLDRSKDRLKEFQKNLDKFNFKATRISAIDGKKLKTNFIDYTPSQIGCASSHIKTWEEIVKNNDMSAIVCEDDIILKDNFKKDLPIFLDQVPDDFDIVFVSSSNCYKDDSKTPIFVKILQQFVNIGNQENTVITENVYIPRMCLTTACYIVSQKGARKLLELLKGNLRFHIDYQIQEHAEHLNIYAFHPKLAYQNTTIQTSTLTNDQKFPLIFNSILDTCKDDSNMSKAYILTTPLFQIGKYVVNGWTIIFLAVGLLVPMKYFKYIVIYMLIEFILLKKYDIDSLILYFVSFGLLSINALTM